MAADLEDRMLQLLSIKGTSARITISDFARTFGANRDVIARCAQQLVAAGTATGTYVDRGGRPSLHALRPAPSAQTPQTDQPDVPAE